MLSAVVDSSDAKFARLQRLHWVKESIINAMVAAETMTGADRVRVHALPHHRLVEILKRYNRLVCDR